MGRSCAPASRPCAPRAPRAPSPGRRPPPGAPLLLGTLATFALVGLVVPGPAPTTRAAQADPVPAAADPNPRNVRREGPVLPYLRTDARRPGAAPGARRAFADGEIVRWSVAPDLRARQVPMPPVRFALDRRPREPVRDGGPGDATGGSVRWTATPRREELAAEIDGDRCVIATDALTVVLVIERGTREAGDRRFGSLVRRARASLDALNDLFAASVHPYAPRGVEERFRIDDARVYDRAAGPASVVPDPQAFDLAWVLDEGAPADGKSPAVDGVPTIGGVSSADATAAPPWSVAWEHARWRECLRARGIPRLEGHAPGAGALPGRFEKGLPLPAPFAGDLAAESAAGPTIGEWTAVVLNQRRGVFRPAPADDPVDVRFGVLRSWLPGRVDLVIVRGGAGGDPPRGEALPVLGATVRWWRARGGAGLPDGVAGVAAERVPDGTGLTDAGGRVALAGDLLGRAASPIDRSPWLLLEVEVGAERRCSTLSALDLSLAYARGAKYAATVRLVWERLAVPVAR